MVRKHFACGGVGVTLSCYGFPSIYGVSLTVNVVHHSAKNVRASFWGLRPLATLQRVLGTQWGPLALAATALFSP